MHKYIINEIMQKYISNLEILSTKSKARNKFEIMKTKTEETLDFEGFDYLKFRFV